jgi:hypothetical protein
MIESTLSSIPRSRLRPKMGTYGTTRHDPYRRGFSLAPPASVVTPVSPPLRARNSWTQGAPARLAMKISLQNGFVSRHRCAVGAMGKAAFKRAGHHTCEQRSIALTPGSDRSSSLTISLECLTRSAEKMDRWVRFALCLAPLARAGADGIIDQTYLNSHWVHSAHTVTPPVQWDHRRIGVIRPERHWVCFAHPVARSSAKQRVRTISLIHPKGHWVCFADSI